MRQSPVKVSTSHLSLILTAASLPLPAPPPRYFRLMTNAFDL